MNLIKKQFKIRRKAVKREISKKIMKRISTGQNINENQNITKIMIMRNYGQKI